MTIKTQKAQVVIEDDDEDAKRTNIDSNSDTEQELSNSDISERVSGSESIDDESKELLNEGWADSIAKILKTNKPKKKKTLVLSKAKKLTDPIKKVKTEKYEIATLDGQIKKEQTVVEEKITSSERPPKKKRRELPNLRVKPNILEKDRERTLQKIATKGVVQLFNAVKMQQKDISKKIEEAGPLEVRKEKVLKNIDKRAFLDVLMGEKSSTLDEKMQSQNIIDKQKGTIINKNNESEPTWNILRDDFMMSAKLKDWDKELDNEDNEKEMEVDVEIESE